MDSEWEEEETDAEKDEEDDALVSPFINSLFPIFILQPPLLLLCEVSQQCGDGCKRLLKLPLLSWPRAPVWRGGGASAGREGPGLSGLPLVSIRSYVATLGNRVYGFKLAYDFGST